VCQRAHRSLEKDPPRALVAQPARNPCGGAMADRQLPRARFVRNYFFVPCGGSPDAADCHEAQLALSFASEHVLETGNAGLSNAPLPQSSGTSCVASRPENGVFVRNNGYYRYQSPSPTHVTASPPPSHFAYCPLLLLLASLHFHCHPSRTDIHRRRRWPLSNCRRRWPHGRCPGPPDLPLHGHEKFL